jgi:hypothetical protein
VAVRCVKPHLPLSSSQSCTAASLMMTNAKRKSRHACLLRGAQSPCQRMGGIALRCWRPVCLATCVVQPQGSVPPLVGHQHTHAGNWEQHWQ